MTAAVTRAEKSKAEHVASQTETGVKLALRRLRAYMKRSGRDAYEAFKDFDPDGNWKITLSEFEDILVRTGIPISNTTRSALFHFIDENSDGSIDYREFTRAILTSEDDDGKAKKIFVRASDVGIGGSIQTTKRAQVYESSQCRVSKKTDLSGKSKAESLKILREREEVTAKMALMMAKRKMKGLFGSDAVELHKAFSFFDRDGSGSLTVKEFLEAFGLMSVKMDDGEMDKLAKTFDRDGDGQVNYAEFLAHFAPRNFSLYRPLARMPGAQGDKDEVEKMIEARALMHEGGELSKHEQLEQQQKAYQEMAVFKRR